MREIQAQVQLTLTQPLRGPVADCEKTPLSRLLVGGTGRTGVANSGQGSSSIYAVTMWILWNLCGKESASKVAELQNCKGGEWGPAQREAHEQRGEREGARGAGRHCVFAVLVFLMLMCVVRGADCTKLLRVG